jgi:hypothetical protein
MVAPKNLLSHLVEPQNKGQRLRGQRRDPGMPKSFNAGDTQRDRGASVGRTRIARKVCPPDEEISLLNHLATEGCVSSFMF